MKYKPENPMKHRKIRLKKRKSYKKKKNLMVFPVISSQKFCFSDDVWLLCDN